MGVASALVFVSMVYLGSFLCLPMENDPCVSFLSSNGRVTASEDNQTVVPPTHPSPISSNTTGIQPGTGGDVPPTGNKVEFSVSFVMSSDLSQYAFDALPGQPGTNPDIKVKSGDTVTIHVKNASKSFHAFGIVIDPSNTSDVLWKSAVDTPDQPMKPGESKDVTFVAGTPGGYHYICTVPGHAALGMDANFIVEK